MEEKSTDEVYLLKPNDVSKDLQLVKKCGEQQTLKIFQKLLGLCSREIPGDTSTWQPVLVELLSTTASGNVKDQQLLLAGRILFAILSKTSTIHTLENYLRIFLRLEANKFTIFNRHFNVLDLDTFKLVIINSCLHVKKKGELYSYEIFHEIFNVIEKHCAVYTPHTFFALRLLSMWLNYTKDLPFWLEDTGLEEQLEALMISNWDNCIGDVAKLNSTEVFPTYLKIMPRKYPGFLEESFDLLLDQLSWQNPTKYVILTELHKATKNHRRLEDHHIERIVRNLERSHLKHVSTKLYLAVWSNVNEDKWLNFYRAIHPTLKRWEEERNLGALQLLWDLWLRPTLPKFSDDFFHILWPFFFGEEMIVSQSYFIKLAAEKSVTLASSLIRPTNALEAVKSRVNGHLVKNVWVKDEATGMSFVLDDERECVRLNGFTAYCRGVSFNSVSNCSNIESPDALSSEADGSVDYEICKWFLYFNAKAASPTLRKGIVDNFRIFMENLMKRNNTQSHSFLRWTYEFILNCFELGSCYQRKIIGLRLYEVVLQFFEMYKIKLSCNINSPDTKFGDCGFDSDGSFCVLARLCLDPVDEIREKACSILCTHFNSTTLTEGDRDVLLHEGMKNCGSSKFYEVSGGAKLLRVFSKITNEDLSLKLLEEARSQLSAMKADVLKATARGSPFYGALTALLETHLNRRASKDHQYDPRFISKVVELLEEASTFFLSSLSSKSEDTKYSSSFAEMGMAIEDLITRSEISDQSEDCTLSPAHQAVLSCIWMSLATICDAAGELTYIESQSEEVYTRCIDLVASVLMRCRHKGVIEAAGTVLVRLMNNKNLGHTFFATPLEQLLSLNAADRIDLTRRGAGQTIMFHRLMTNDDPRTRPLLHTALQKILSDLKDVEDISTSGKEDNPLARQLHFLRSIVADRSLHPHLVHYMEEISLTCLRHLRSTEWSIRNASLQLLGAVVPRLVGQAGEFDFGTGYSVEHFFTHYPGLATKVLEELRNRSVENYDGLMPVLTLLSKMTVSGCDYVDYSSGEYREQVARELYLLLGHPVAMVRNLAAKTYAAFVPPRFIAGALLCMAECVDDRGGNFAHGFASAQFYLEVRARYEAVWSAEDAKRIREATDLQLTRLQGVVRRWCRGEEINYVVESVFLKSLLASLQLDQRAPGLVADFDHSAIARRVDGEGNRPGFWEFVDRLAEVTWRLTDFDELLRKFGDVLCSGGAYSIALMKSTKEIRKLSDCESEECGDSMERRKSTLLSLLQNINKLVEEEHFQLNGHTQHVVEFMIKILENSDFTQNGKAINDAFEDSRLPQKLITSKNNYLRKLGYTLTALTRSDKNVTGTLDFLVNTIRSNDEWGKLWALGCLEKCLHQENLTKVNDVHRLTVVECLVCLLTDESPEIRAAVARKSILTTVTSSSNPIGLPKNPELYLHDVLRAAVTSSIKNNHQDHHEWLRNLVKHTVTEAKYVRSRTGDVSSPFEHDETYREDSKILGILTYLTSTDSPANERHNVTKIVEIGNDCQQQYVALLTEKSPKLLIMLNLKVEDYVSNRTEALCNIKGNVQ